MAYVYKSTMSQWNAVEQRYDDMFTDYFSSKKKAIDNAVDVIKIMHAETAEVTKGETYTYVTTTNHRDNTTSVKDRNGRSYFITQHYVA